jgi:polyphosphate kinase
MHFPFVGAPELRYTSFPPLEQNHIEDTRSIINTIRSKDVLLHYPYQSFNYIIDLLREAAIDPNVKSIKMTLYRLAEKSSVVNALINARRNGKAVTVVIELQARFDEEANIYWTKKLEEEGARIIDGVPGLKVHAKLVLITRHEKNRVARYASIGTGNFNESTARIYSDHSLLTAHKQITREVADIFDFLEHNYKSFTYKHLLVAPFYLRKKLRKFIKDEIKIAQAGRNAYIHLKLNNLVDGEMIDRLYEASQAGVQIKMIVRGICSLVPGVQGLSENIEVVSIVDKYLEHSRIYIFGNDGKERMYLSSADLMIRNLDNRVEVAAPVYDPSIQKELHDFLDIQYRDNVKARIIDRKLDNRYKQQDGQERIRAQEKIYTYLKNKS